MFSENNDDPYLRLLLMASEPHTGNYQGEEVRGNSRKRGPPPPPPPPGIYLRYM